MFRIVLCDDSPADLMVAVRTSGTIKKKTACGYHILHSDGLDPL